MSKISITYVKPMITLQFYTEYQKKILDVYKYEKAIVPIYAFYERQEHSFLRIEDFSFDPKLNPQKSGKLFMLNGTLAHYSTSSSYEELSNKDEVVNKAKENKSQFILFIYGDLKTFHFKYKFVFLHGNTVEYKITKIVPEIQDETMKKEIDEYIKSQTEVNQPAWYSPENSKYILINDLTTVKMTLPILIKNALHDIYDTNNNIEYVIVNKGELFLQLKMENISIKKDDMQLIQELISSSERIVVDLKQMFNPETIAENAVDLNINLMKWRMSPLLNTDIIRQSKYLLIGAGTLGCHVSRCLMGWGARSITFVDNGKVSYSNPVRQSLYTFKDSQNTENNYKALLAAEKLKEIFPMVESRGINMTIPLPGRTLIDQQAKDNYIKNLLTLEKEIQEHDIIFLLTDSRESRWYPTLIAKAFNKTVITAAIGFDSYLVMRHGTKENKLGCYFCTDIVSPTDTSGSRTLDQQCTISRPGVSMICSGLACELAMSLMNPSLNLHDEGEEEVPHQMRGNIMNYSLQLLKHTENTLCIACCEKVVKEYQNNRDEFIERVMNEQYYLEKISGVQELLEQVKNMEFLEGDDF